MLTRLSRLTYAGQVHMLAKKRTPCTVCPISNHRAQIVPRCVLGSRPPPYSRPLPYSLPSLIGVTAANHAEVPGVDTRHVQHLLRRESDPPMHVCPCMCACVHVCLCSIFCGESPIRPMIESGVNIAGLHRYAPMHGRTCTRIGVHGYRHTWVGTHACG